MAIAVVVEMEVNEEVYRIEIVTSFGIYFVRKPPEKSVKKPIQQADDIGIKV